jgi:hypothetical protein
MINDSISHHRRIAEQAVPLAELAPWGMASAPFGNAVSLS